MLFLFIFTKISFTQESQQIILNDTGYGSDVWILSANTDTETSISITKQSNKTDRWVITDFSGGGTQNGYVRVLINGIEKWRLYFPANGSTGQKVVIPSNFNDTIKVEAVINSSGKCAVNVRGTKW